MKILSVNAGSSSLKFQMYEMPEEEVLISGVFERIGISGSVYTIKFKGEKIKKEVPLQNHKEAFTILMQELLNYKVVNDLDEIKGVGHRVVQGGTYYSDSVIINDDVISKIDELSVLAPLHNPAGIIGIRASQEVIPNAINVAVFDTAFHQTMSEEDYLYALPRKYEKEYKIRKYGMHGTSHKYVSERINQILGRDDTKVIICHIGNGASISAVENGKCVNTSMGLTPNAGLIMGTRCGDIDATIVTYMINTLGMSASEVDNVMNKESGLLGISGVGSDSRDIEDAIKAGNKDALLAQKMYVRRIIDYIAKYYVQLGGCDAICFTAGVGENSILTREQVLDGLKVLGVEIDREKNNVRGEEKCITTANSSIDVYVIPTDEEVMIARDTYNFVK